MSHVDDKWMKRELVQGIIPYEDSNMTYIKGRPDYCQMSSNDIFNEIVALTISTNNAEDALTHGHGSHKGNLSLKAKVVEHDGEKDDDDNIEWGFEDTNFKYHDQMVLAAKHFWGRKCQSFIRRDNTKISSRGPNPRVRSCYV
jgi:hypothetical protein